MKDWKLEKSILYILIIVLIAVLITLVLYMNFTLLDLSFYKDAFNNLSSFIGALMGALITGGIAIGLILYQRYHDKKDSHFKVYGHMKYVAVRLIVFGELRKLALRSIDPVRGCCDETNDLHRTLISRIPLSEFQKLLDILNQLKDNVPYEYVSRYYSAINSLEYVNLSLKRLSEEMSESNIEVVISHLESTDSILLRLSQNLLEYTLDLEKKYGISDAY